MIVNIFKIIIEDGVVTSLSTRGSSRGSEVSCNDYYNLYYIPPVTEPTLTLGRVGDLNCRTAKKRPQASGRMYI